MPGSTVRRAIAHPVHRRALRLMGRGASLSIVDPLLGDEHDLPTATERLWAALHTFDLDALRTALRFQPDLDARYQPNGQDEVLREQKEPGPDEDEFEPTPEATPLEHCLKHRRADLGHALLAAGANPNSIGPNSRLLLGDAARQDLEFLNLLIGFKAVLDPSQLPRSAVAPLHDAVDALNPAAVCALLAAGAPLDVDLPRDDAALYHPLNTEAPIVAVLKKLATPEAQAVIGLLLDAGARVDLVDANGANALHHLCTNDPTWIGRLIALGADPAGEDITGRTPLHHLVPYREQHTPEHEAVHHATLHALLAAGASINALDQQGKTPLVIAVRNNAPLGTLRHLLDAGADPLLADPYGNSARSDVERRQSSWSEDHPAYVDQVFDLFIEVEQQQLRALANAVVPGDSVMPRARRSRL